MKITSHTNNWQDFVGRYDDNQSVVYAIYFTPNARLLKAPPALLKKPYSIQHTMNLNPLPNS